MQEVIDSGKTNLHFVRVHAPWVVLCKYAEELNLRAPIQVREREGGEGRGNREGQDGIGSGKGWHKLVKSYSPTA